MHHCVIGIQTNSYEHHICYFMSFQTHDIGASAANYTARCAALGFHIVISGNKAHII